MNGCRKTRDKPITSLSQKKQTRIQFRQKTIPENNTLPCRSHDARAVEGELWLGPPPSNGILLALTRGSPKIEVEF